jgi:tetratricopeptide (TPR) repeat protein
MGSLADRLSALPYHEQRGPFLLHGANFHFALHLSQRFAMDQDFFAALTQSLAIYARLSRNIVEASRLSSQLAQRGSAVMNWNLEAHGYLQLGIIVQEQRDFATAREWCFKSLAISEKQGYPQGAALTYRQLGMIAQGERDFAAAREWYLKSLAISEKQGDLNTAAVTNHQLGIIAQGERDFATAREWYLKSLNIKEQQGDLDGAANTYQHLGIVAQEERDFATAREWYLKSLAIKEKRGNLHEAAMTYGQLGIVAARQGNFEEGGKWYARAITGFQQTRDQHEVERNVQNFLIAYRRVPSAEKEKLKAIWLEAGLGAFPA